MKRIFTSFALLCATVFALHAQDCVFQYQGKELENGSTITIQAEEEPSFHDFVCNTNPTANSGLFFVNKGRSDVSCSATITITSKTMKTSLIQWCMGSQCVPINGSTYTKTFTTAAGNNTPVQYDCITIGEGEMLTLLEVKTGNQTYSVNIRFVNGDDTHVGAATAAVTPVAYYTLDGREVSARPRGLCLVKFSDGRVRKVVGK